MEQLDDILQKATAAIGGEYFPLPISTTRWPLSRLSRCLRRFHALCSALSGPIHGLSVTERPGWGGWPGGRLFSFTRRPPPSLRQRRRHGHDWRASSGRNSPV